MIPEASNLNASKAIRAARALSQAVFEKLEQSIAYMGARGEDPTNALRLQARASQTISFLDQLSREVERASAEVSAPTVEEIRAVRSLADQVKALAVTDAVAGAGFETLSQALETAIATSEKTTV